MGPTSNTSIWEDPTGTDGTIYVAYDGDEIVELVIQLDGDVSDVASELERRFGLTEALSNVAG